MGELCDPAAFRALFDAELAGVYRYVEIIAFDPDTADMVAEGSSDGAGGIRWQELYAVRSGAVEQIGERP